VPDGTLLIHIALILLMVFLLNATLFKPINRILEERERRTRGRSGEARGTLQKVDEMLATYKRTLHEARSEGYRLMEEMRAEAMRERQAKIGAMREELESSVAVEKEAIRSQSAEARAKLERDAREIAMQISSQILHRPVGDSTTGFSSRV
jgi:F-type H+-transporting ATPase subunit b